MKINLLFLPATIFAAALLVLFACSPIINGEAMPQDLSSSSVDSSSSSIQSSSSSFVMPSSSSFVTPSSSSVCVQTEMINGSPVSYGDETYETVVICDQTWMARNLNYNVEGSICNYYDDPDNCVKYGRHYDWATAMALESSCNSNSCTSQLHAKHRGICPEGWHIPSDAEWTALKNYVGGSNIAGRKLKATNGWNSCGLFDSGKSYVCEDSFGFAALPGGFGMSGGSFGVVGNSGYWWSASESYSNSAYSQNMNYRDDGINSNNRSAKTNFFSVRCVQDSVTSLQQFSSSSASPSSSSVMPSSSSICTQTGIINGSSVSYGDETYETVVICDQTWMARNLNYNADGSVCYSNSEANCDKYGRLYDWATAMNLPSSCNFNTCASQVQFKHRGICPEGWHIPSDVEWTALTDNVGGVSTAGAKLKAASGWNFSNGTDEFGFAALPGGGGRSDGYFYYYGSVGYWWSSRGYDFAWIWNIQENIFRDTENKTNLLSVRCIKD